MQIMVASWQLSVHLLRVTELGDLILLKWGRRREGGVEEW